MENPAFCDGTGSQNTSDDYFADSSVETVMQNVNEEFPPPPVIDENLEKSLDDRIVDKFVSESNLPARICCPFCVLDFGYEVLLKEHIKQSHAREFKLVLESSRVEFHRCPFCDSKFYTSDLLPKHILRRHELCVVAMFSDLNPEKYIFCRFCPHKIMRKHYKLLMIHIEKKHYALFEKFIATKYSNMFNFEAHYDTPTKEVKESPIKPILKAKTSYPLEWSETVTDETYHNLIPEQKPSRKLRFNLPEDDKANKKWTLKKKKTENKENIAKEAGPSKKRKVEPKVTKENIETSLFKCGICHKSFEVNAKLLEHVRSAHKGFNLHARYKCGECNAKFYKNDYLVKHCSNNHGPLCLKSPEKVSSPMQF